MAVKIAKIETLVKRLLQRDISLADCDERLVATVWWHEANLENVSATDFLKAYASGSFTNSESITRARRKIEEENVSLRGYTYDKRHGKDKRKEVLTELGYNHG